MSFFPIFPAYWVLEVYSPPYTVGEASAIGRATSSGGREFVIELFASDTYNYIANKYIINKLTRNIALASSFPGYFSSWCVFVLTKKLKHVVYIMIVKSERPQSKSGPAQNTNFEHDPWSIASKTYCENNEV
jgi:hypothetical protein